MGTDDAFRCLDMRPVRLPEDGPLQRDVVLKPAARPDGFAARYDFHTLIYHATYVPGRRAVVLVCPRLFNLRDLVAKGRYTSRDGGHRLIGHRRYRRHEELWLAADQCPHDLRLQAAGLDLPVPVAPPDTGLTGTRCVSTKSKDNRLEWIRDWAAHYVRHQGAHSVLLFDNGSTTYSPGDVLEVLRGVAGLTRAVVVSAPLPFGPIGTRTPMAIALFLQCGLLNVTRHHFAPGLASLLSCDIDELAVSDRGQGSLFEAAERSWLGYATAPVRWRHARLKAGAVPRHSDHLWRTAPETGTKEKWAIVPNGRLGRFAWDCHGVGRYQFNALAQARGQRFLHCAQVNTHWKGARGAEGLVRDPLAEAVFGAEP